MTVDKIILGYNTSLQVFNDMKEDQLTIHNVVVSNDVPPGMSEADFEQHKEHLRHKSKFGITSLGKLAQQ